MNNLEKIKLIRELESQKIETEKKLAIINRNIEQQKELCSHILVKLGRKGIVTDYEYCLLCGQKA